MGMKEVDIDFRRMLAFSLWIELGGVQTADDAGYRGTGFRQTILMYGTDPHVAYVFQWSTDERPIPNSDNSKSRFFSGVQATIIMHSYSQSSRVELPLGSKVLSVIESSFRVRTFRITAELSDGTIVSYFKKGATGAKGAKMMEGTFASEQALYNAIPQHVPKPLAWGAYYTQPDTYFYICEFIEMLDDVPSARQWAGAVAALHSASMGKSPTGQFGFPLATHLANVPVDNKWNPSWEKFWAQQMKSLLDAEEALHGADEEFTQLKERYFRKVIPRLLSPLETNGRSIQPCIIHSDLWPGNIKPKVEGDDVCMFDGCSYWGHNEADLGVIPASEPEEDFDDRNALYALKYHVLLSIIDAPIAEETAAGEDTSVAEKTVVVEETAIEEKTAVVEKASIVGGILPKI
ncbi:hypothetical protein V502_08408 [Pseudogymnoascus sp. VKM F-4520 (FW-2644)]|nr:hypothetical protein V502_08408 [Pseudogymnoascus sp. VKM F-4520 (FW-2644)]